MPDPQRSLVRDGARLSEEQSGKTIPSSSLASLGTIAIVLFMAFVALGPLSLPILPSMELWILRDRSSLLNLDYLIDKGHHAARGRLVDPVFPLSVSENGRYLRDAKGQPFLVTGEAVWSLISGLTQEDVKAYLADRRARGFNTLLVSLIEHVSPKNAYGQDPFLGAVAFSAPNEAYFEQADWVIREAARQGFLVLLVPAYLGFEGGNEGWYKDLLAAGQDRLRDYGNYIAKRYQGFDNIVWVQGGDFNPPQRYVVRTLAEAIQARSPGILQSVHNGPETAGLDYWHGEPWLRVNTVYTYKPVYEAVARQYRRADPMPVIMLESAYELEHEATAHRIRTQAYQALLSGASGQVFGNNPVWHFDKPGLYTAPMDWRQSLDSPGSRSMTHLRNFFEQFPWWDLEPDIDGRFLIAGEKEGQSRAVAAVTSDRRLAIVYVPDARPITLDLQELTERPLTARWYDPRQGRFLPMVNPATPPKGKIASFATPATSGADDDWLLVVQAKD